MRSNIIHGISGFAGIKLLGPADPTLPLPPLHLELSRFSKSAAKAVIDAGGKVSAVYHNRLGLRSEVWPEKFEGKPIQLAKPTRKTDIRTSKPMAVLMQNITLIQRSLGTLQKTLRHDAILTNGASACIILLY